MTKSLQKRLAESIGSGATQFSKACDQVYNNQQLRQDFNIEAGNEEQIIQKAHAIIWGDRGKSGFATKFAQATSHDAAIKVAKEYNNTLDQDDISEVVALTFVKGAGRFLKHKQESSPC